MDFWNLPGIKVRQIIYLCFADKKMNTKKIIILFSTKRNFLGRKLMVDNSFECDFSKL